MITDMLTVINTFDVEVDGHKDVSIKTPMRIQEPILPVEGEWYFDDVGWNDLLYPKFAILMKDSFDRIPALGRVRRLKVSNVNRES